MIMMAFSGWGEACGFGEMQGDAVTVRSVVVLLIVSAVVAGTATTAFATDHDVSGSTINEVHRLIVLIGSAQCDPSNGDPANPDDPNNICRYAIRGKYADTSQEGYLGAGRVNGRFLFHTTSFDAPTGQYGCFHPSGGVVKFTDAAGDRLRFKIGRETSTICQVWDGTTDGPDGVRTEPTRN